MEDAPHITDDEGLPPHHANIPLLAIIRERLEALGLSERKACLNARLKVDAIRQIKRGHRPHVDKLAALAPVLGVPLASLVSALGPDGAEPEPSRAATHTATGIPVVGRVQAGYWTGAHEWPNDERFSVAVPPLRSHPGLRRYGLVVTGQSMNRVYPENTIAICAKYLDLGRAPLPGDRVVCIRRDPASEDFEATIKEYQPGLDGQHMLWPRSNDKAHQAPIMLPGPPAAGEWVHDAGTPDLLIEAMVVQTICPEPNID